MDILTQFYPDMHDCKNTNEVDIITWTLKSKWKQKEKINNIQWEINIKCKNTANVRNQVLNVVSQSKRENSNHSTFLLLNTLIHGASLHDYFWKKKQI